MGTKGREIVGMDVDQLVEKLNKALADEWLAYYQYWIGAKVAEGPMHEGVAMELEEHANEELAHAQLLTDRIMQLGGTPLLTPQDWYDMTNCGYDAPEDPFVRTLLEQNIAGEQCAIDVYQDLQQEVRDADPITHQMILSILADEIEHEEDLQGLLEDMELMQNR